MSVVEVDPIAPAVTGEEAKARATALPLAIVPAEPYSGPVIGRLLTLRLIRNPGAAFSQGEGFTWVFAVAAVLVLAFVLVRLVPRLGHVGWTVALALLAAGVAGNLSDRLFRAPGPFRGHVVDFLQLPHWPIFNVADMCITTAAVMIVVLSLLRNVGIDGRHPGDQDGQSPSPTDPAAGPTEPTDPARPAPA